MKDINIKTKLYKEIYMVFVTNNSSYFKVFDGPVPKMIRITGETPEEHAVKQTAKNEAEQSQMLHPKSQ